MLVISRDTSTRALDRVKNCWIGTTVLFSLDIYSNISITFISILHIQVEDRESYFKYAESLAYACTYWNKVITVIRIIHHVTVLKSKSLMWTFLDDNELQNNSMICVIVVHWRSAEPHFKNHRHSKFAWKELKSFQGQFASDQYASIRKRLTSLSSP